MAELTLNNIQILYYKRLGCVRLFGCHVMTLDIIITDLNTPIQGSGHEQGQHEKKISL